MGKGVGYGADSNDIKKDVVSCSSFSYSNSMNICTYDCHFISQIAYKLWPKNISECRHIFKLERFALRSVLSSVFSEKFS
jgi:hypothetical protein